MPRHRLVVYLDQDVFLRIRACGEHADSGGVSGYLERLVRRDELSEAAAAVGRWHSAHPELEEIDELERLAIAVELGETA